MSTFVNGGSATNIIVDKSLTIRRPTFRAALDHRFSDAVLGYVSFNTGIKSGGFNTVSPANPAYLPEKLTAYEVGLKTELLDRRLRLNLAGFYYDYTNLQVIQFVGLTQTVVNGPGAKLYGLDVDFEAQIARGLRASGGIEIEHSEFTNYPGAVFSTPRPTGGALIFSGDATGDRLPLAQKFTATTAVDYHTDFDRGALDLNATANYNGAYFFEADNFLRQKAYLILNASVKWTLPGDRLSITASGRTSSTSVSSRRRARRASAIPPPTATHHARTAWPPRSSSEAMLVTPVYPESRTESMTFITNAWYVAALSEEVTPALMSRTLLGTPTLLWRQEDGQSSR